MDKLNLNPFGMSEQSFDSNTFDMLKIESFNKRKGDLTGYDCPKCLNRGQYAIPRESGGMSIVEQNCGPCMTMG